MQRGGREQEQERGQLLHSYHKGHMGARNGYDEEKERKEIKKQEG